MRDDTSYCVKELSRTLGGGRASGLRNPQAVAEVISENYRLFQADMRRALGETIRCPRGVTFHLLDAQLLEQSVRHRAGAGPLLSLDPLIEQADHVLRASRGFLLGGDRPVGLVPSPGTQSFHRQLAGLSADAEYTLIEDDIFTGGTIKEVIRMVRRLGMKVGRVVPGIRLSSEVEDLIPGVVVDPVMRYHILGDSKETRPLEIADPRNFLLGVSGLVVCLPDGSWTRAPYWLPFVRAAARIGISPACEEEFALLAMRANLDFYSRIQKSLDVTIRISDFSPTVRDLLPALGFAHMSTPVCTALEHMMTHLDRHIEVVAGGGRTTVESRDGVPSDVEPS
ncbi:MULTISPECIES: hypothetical protein [unclassified Streptomyces]|uniref:hypothetical protein n=1 Tax=unclassified Streptomyces TaxID=2593676 RepID=UPI0038128C65